MSLSSREFTENCQPASGSSGHSVVDNIRRIALEFGVVTVFRAYLELRETVSSRTYALRSQLHSSGVSLIDCPHNGSKEVADKMLLGALQASYEPGISQFIFRQSI